MSTRATPATPLSTRIAGDVRHVAWRRLWDTRLVEAAVEAVAGIRTASDAVAWIPTAPAAIREAVHGAARRTGQVVPPTVVTHLATTIVHAVMVRASDSEGISQLDPGTPASGSRNSDR